MLFFTLGLFELIGLKMFFLYRRWFCMESDDPMDSSNDTLIETFTNSAISSSDPSFEVFYAIADSISNLESVLASNRFDTCLRRICSKICQLFFDELIFVCTFNNFGASKLDKDVRNGLLPLFKTYLHKPENHFIE